MLERSLETLASTLKVNSQLAAVSSRVRGLVDGPHRHIGGSCMSNAWENFFAATAMLASAGPIKHRLAEAYRTHLESLDRDDLPKEIREEFSAISNQMCRVRPLRGETAVQATVRKMSDIEAGGVAMRIVNLLGFLARHQQIVQRAPKLRAVGDE
jgi:hypothetical protein